MDSLVYASSELGRSYGYDSDRRLVEMEDIYERWEYSWDGDKLIKATRETSEPDQNCTWDYHYSGKTAKGYMPIFLEDPLQFVHPQLFGLRTTHLPDYATSDYGGRLDYTYTFYKDGYIETIKVQGEDSDNAGVYTFVWE